MALMSVVTVRSVEPDERCDSNDCFDPDEYFEPDEYFDSDV